MPVSRSKAASVSGPISSAKFAKLTTGWPSDDGPGFEPPQAVSRARREQAATCRIGGPYRTNRALSIHRLIGCAGRATSRPLPRPSLLSGLSLPRTVIVLGLVSLLNDAASEMITPLLPIFLTAALGAGPAVVGFVEGLAEATASVLKLVAGRLADRGVRSKSLVLGGYGLSNLTRPLIGLAAAWSAVLLLRFLDRVGKGLRTAPRDALIAGATAPQLRGRAFGFHRSMDHAGAVVGPLVAFALLAANADLKHVFLASVVPGILVLLLLAFGL